MVLWLEETGLLGGADASTQAQRWEVDAQLEGYLDLCSSIEAWEKLEERPDS